MSSSNRPPLTIGVLALQGAFQEHCKILKELEINAVEIRMPEDLHKDIDGLIIPGGESTAMAIVGEKNGIFPILREFVSSGKPVWGTCAGMILLSNKAVMQKEGGQPLIGGLDVEVCRNFFGSQVSSFEVVLELEGEIAGAGPQSAVFIRAPAILEAGPNVEVLARVKAHPCEAAKPFVEDTFRQQQQGVKVSGREDERKLIKKEEDDRIDVMVAVKEGNILATAFHPELTNERWWHEFFCRLCKQK